MKAGWVGSRVAPTTVVIVVYIGANMPGLRVGGGTTDCVAWA